MSRRRGAGLTIDELLNLKFPVAVCDLEPARFEDGVHPGSGPAEVGIGVTVPISVQVVGAKGGEEAGGLSQGELEAAVGDLTGDGVADGAVIVGEYCGGASGTVFYATYAFDSSGKSLGTVPVDVNEPGATFPAVHSDLEIVDGGIELDGLGYTAAASHVDGPSIEEHLRFEWNGSEFEQVG